MTINPIVVDLSHWNPTPNWKELALNGTLGVIHKATQGVSYTDPAYGGREEEARAAGLLWASYHFLEHGAIEEQMSYYVTTAGLEPGDRAIIDFEPNPNGTDPNLEDLEEAVTLLLDTYALEVCVYGSSLLTETCSAPNDTLSRTSLWQARYSSKEPAVPAPWGYWSLWQYTDKATVKGISAPVDGNKWNGDANGLVDWFEGPNQPKPPKEMIDIQIDCPPGMQIRVVVNGEEIA